MCQVIVWIIMAAAFFLQGLAADDRIFPYPVQQTRLDNGLNVISVTFDSPGIVAYYTVVRTGSRNEIEPGLSGFAHFFEHMMFRGTEKYSKDRYNDMLKSIGADDNAFTSDDVTVYHTLASSEALETLMDLQSDRFINLKYSEEDFKTEAGAILGEYNKNYSNPVQSIMEKLREASYQRHTYKHTTMGFLKDIMDMPNQYQYSLQFFSRWYRPEHCALLVVGDIQHGRLVELARKYYGGWTRGSFNLDVPLDPLQAEEKMVRIQWKAETLPVLAIGYHGPAFSDIKIDMPAMDLLSQVLFSETSDLFRKLVIEDSVVEFVDGGETDSRDPGLFTIFSRIKDPARVEYVRDQIFTAIENARHELVSADRLAQIKSFMKYNFALGLDSANAIARILAHYIQLTGDPESVNRVYGLYDRVTPEDIRMVAEKYFGATNRTIVVLTKEGGQP